MQHAGDGPSADAIPLLAHELEAMVLSRREHSMTSLAANDHAERRRHRAKVFGRPSLAGRGRPLVEELQ